MRKTEKEDVGEREKEREKEIARGRVIEKTERVS